VNSGAQEIVEGRTEVHVIYTWGSGTTYLKQTYITASISLIQMSQCTTSISIEGSIAEAHLMHDRLRNSVSL